jgi:hypothetical protein
LKSEELFMKYVLKLLLKNQLFWSSHEEQKDDEPLLFLIQVRYLEKLVYDKWLLSRHEL